MKKPVLILSKW